MFLLQHLFMTNILRLTVLAGTFSLALAFAGNDLVNFIGVFMGGLDSFQYARGVVADGGSTASITAMECLMPGKGGPVNHYILFAAGCMMIFALWFSKKAKTVIATGVELSRQGEGGIERFGSVPPARAIVRSACPGARCEKTYSRPHAGAHEPPVGPRSPAPESQGPRRV